MHEAPLLRKSGLVERATIRASPLYCVETGALQGFSLLLCAFMPVGQNEVLDDSGMPYASPAIPAASVEGLRNVAPSVLRLLQIGGDEPWQGPLSGVIGQRTAAGAEPSGTDPVQATETAAAAAERDSWNSGNNGIKPAAPIVSHPRKTQREGATSGV